MQAPKRLSVKLFASNPEVAAAEQFTPIFQRWIQRKAIANELLIDVADYKHAPRGPGILLIGHEGDYAYDFTDARAGLQYTLKRHHAASPLAAVNLALSRLLVAANILRGESDLNGLTFAANDIQITLLDRLRYPNQSETIAAVLKVLQPLAAGWYGEFASVTAQKATDPREPLRITIATDQAHDLADIQANLEAPVV